MAGPEERKSKLRCRKFLSRIGNGNAKNRRRSRAKSKAGLQTSRPPDSRTVDAPTVEEGLRPHCDDNLGEGARTEEEVGRPAPHPETAGTPSSESRAPRQVESRCDPVDERIQVSMILTMTLHCAAAVHWKYPGETLT